jgi:hypothetical protein
MQCDHHWDAKLSLERESGGRVDGKVSMQESGLAAAEAPRELRCDAGGEEQAAAKLVRGLITRTEERNLAGIDEKTGGDGAEPGKARSVTTKRVSLSGDKGF